MTWRVVSSKRLSNFSIAARAKGCSVQHESMLHQYAIAECLEQTAVRTIGHPRMAVLLSFPNSMESQEIFVHIDWSGPHNLNDIASLNGDTDYGIYQIYGAHPVYGSDVLLYIGLAAQQTFAVRLSQHHAGCNSNPDAGRVQIYIGRLWGTSTPDSDTWERHIALAERLLIYTHQLAENAQKELKAMEPALRHVHVINWHRYRDLLPEVSGACWTERFADVQTYRHFGTPDPAAPPTVSNQHEVSLTAPP
jgi:hypothetical protein